MVVSIVMQLGQYGRDCKRTPLFSVLERVSTRVAVVVVVVVVQPDCLYLRLCACLKRNGAQVATIS